MDTEFKSLSKYNYSEHVPYWDFIVLIDDTKFHLHKLILGYNFHYFEGLFRQNLKENADNMCNLKQCSVNAFRSLMNFVYTKPYIDDYTWSDTKVSFKENIKIYLPELDDLDWLSMKLTIIDDSITIEEHQKLMQLLYDVICLAGKQVFIPNVN